MDRKNILDELNKKLNVISNWNPAYYEVLSKLSNKDIIDQTENSINSTLALEYLFNCSEIKFSLTDYELELLESINDSCNTNKLKKIIEIIELSAEYVDSLEIDEINHPVCEYNNAKEILLYHSNNFYQKLENLYTKYPFTINKAYYEMTTTENIPELNNINLYFLFQNGSIEEIINYLKNYVTVKLKDNCCENEPKNYINTEIMKNLYEYSDMYLYDKDLRDKEILLIDEVSAVELILDSKFMYLYGEVYKSYIETKRYLATYQIKEVIVNEYKQKCKIL